MAILSRRKFLTASTAFLSLSGMRAQAKSSPPNILYIMADDLGWADLSCYGRKEYTTPHLDKLAASGTKFTQAYSGSCLCTPTRVSFNTGRYPGRLAIGTKEPLTWKRNIGDAVGLPPSMPTVASLLKKAGYETALIGKWHLGYLPTYSPLKSGFDHFFGIMSGGVDYFTHRDQLGDPDLFEDEVPVERTGYITDLITARAVNFVQTQRTSPFFLSLNYTAPHWPWEGPKDEEKSKTLKNWLTEGGSSDVYGAMVQSLDSGIGKVLTALREQKLEENTLILFTSDNGGERFSSQWPFSGEKYDLLEGGIRVPTIISWNGIIPKGKISRQVAISMDWTKTLLAAGGTDEDPAYPMDGMNLLPILTGKADEIDRTLYWRTKDQYAVRSGEWKYYRKLEKLKDCTEEHEHLYNLRIDEREKTDFKTQETTRFAQLKEAFVKWNSEMLPY